MEDFSTIAKQYEPMIHQIIRRLSIYKNKEDFFQMGLIALWEAYEKFDSKQGDFLNYAYMTVKGRMINEIKRQQRRELLAISLEHFDALGLDDGSFDCYERLQLDDLDAYTENLTVNQKRWLVLTFIEQMSLAEIAATYDVSVAAVKSWRRSALRKLREEIETDEKAFY